MVYLGVCTVYEGWRFQFSSRHLLEGLDTDMEWNVLCKLLATLSLYLSKLTRLSSPSFAS
jgi:hypothetical protein